MHAMKIHTLGKNERLKSRKQIDVLFDRGKKMILFPFRLMYWVSKGEYDLKAGFTVSSRNFPKATDRNRIKRLTREAYRLQKSALAETLRKNRQAANLFFIYTGRDLPELSLIQKTIQQILEKLIRQLHEGNS
jgi:ribonuclease P protein component